MTKQTKRGGSTVDTKFYGRYTDWKDKNKKRYIDKKDKSYNARLNKTSKVNDNEITFRKQYEEADGNELKKKFWDKISSSRMCFELYSWIPYEYEDIDFAFEKQLDTVKSRNTKSRSNMDVYIKTNDKIWFIESKFTENNGNKIPGAYYQSLDENGNYIKTNYKNPTYYYVASGKKLADKPQSLSERFRGHDDIIEPFISFVNDIISFQNKGNRSQWFDVKQETCHLLGIILYIIDNKEELEGKTINFRNIVFNRGGCEQYITDDLLAKHFMEKAKELVNKKIFGKEVFTYSALSIQEVLKNNCDKTVRESIENNFKGIKDLLEC